MVGKGQVDKGKDEREEEDGPHLTVDGSFDLVFIEPPSLEELERRLRGRGTETDDVVDMRMRTALVELSQKMEYDYRLVNDDLDEATRQLVAYVNEIAEQQ